MKRRFMMWMTIVCILVVGVSVTRMTQDFVTSQGVETAALINVAEIGSSNAPVEVLSEETTAVSSPEEDAEDTMDQEDMVIAASIRDTIVEITPILVTEEPVPTGPKSPLDPVVTNDSMIEASVEKRIYQAKDFFERFAQTEQNALGLWENISSDNRAAYIAAAEQERILWENELNQVSQVIREHLSLEEIEALKVLEIEWIKERDLYAEKIAAKSSMKNAQNQNPEYTRALVEKTKERCYWLVSEYEDVLNQE